MTTFTYGTIPSQDYTADGITLEGVGDTWILTGRYRAAGSGWERRMVALTAEEAAALDSLRPPTALIDAARILAERGAPHDIDGYTA